MNKRSFDKNGFIWKLTFSTHKKCSHIHLLLVLLLHSFPLVWALSNWVGLDEQWKSTNLVAWKRKKSIWNDEWLLFSKFYHFWHQITKNSSCLKLLKTHFNILVVLIFLNERKQLEVQSVQELSKCHTNFNERESYIVTFFGSIAKNIGPIASLSWSINYYN